MNFLNKYEKVVVVIPAFNEGIRIVDILQRTAAIYQNIVLVDDASSDNTSFIAKEYCRSVIKLETNHGAGYATKVGCDFAFNNLNAHYVVTIDGDGQHAPEDIHLLLEKLISNNLDIVFGFRPRKNNMPFIKKVGNLMLSKLSAILFKVYLTDTLTGFHAFTNHSYPKLRWESNRYAFVSEYVYRISLGKLKYGEVAVQTIYNDKKSGMNIFDGLQSIVLMFAWRFSCIKSLLKMFAKEKLL